MIEGNRQLADERGFHLALVADDGDGLGEDSAAAEHVKHDSGLRLWHYGCDANLPKVVERKRLGDAFAGERAGGDGDGLGLLGFATEERERDAVILGRLGRNRKSSE